MRGFWEGGVASVAPSCFPRLRDYLLGECMRWVVLLLTQG
jgi:hypothetical protein